MLWNYHEVYNRTYAIVYILIIINLYVLNR